MSAAPESKAGQVKPVALGQLPDFSFDPHSYREIRNFGEVAFRSFIGTLATDVEVRGEIARGHLPDAKRIMALFQRLSEVERLPLRVLVCIGGNLTWGALERFYAKPLSARGLPASEPLRAWYQRYREDFKAFFPEQDVPGLPDLEEVDGGPDTVWVQLGRLIPRFAKARGGPPSDAAGFFLLLRDEPEALEGLTRRLDLGLDRLARRAFEDSGEETANAAAEVYGSLRVDDELPAGMPLAFVSMVLTLETGTAASIRSSVSREELIAALQGAEPEPATVLDFGKRAVRDLPAEEDQLGVTPLVEGLRALLDDEQTDLPLAVGINAPWGAGKSSVMLQLRRALERDGNNRDWIPVSFDAWKYERGEQLWAAMARSIYEQGERSLGFWSWIGFKMRLERSRRGRANTHVRVLALCLLGVLLLGTTLAGLGLLPTLLTAAAMIGIGGETISGAWGLIGDPFKRAIDDYASRPNYEKYLGFTSEADRDIRAMTGELTKGEKTALIVFVDDLDRCSPRYIVDVVEAVNQIFNSSHEASCAFVLGMDRDVVVAGIESAYGDSARSAGGSESFGLAFLAKLVQLSVTIPPPDEKGLGRLLTSLSRWEAISEHESKMGEVAGRRQQLERAGAADPVAVQREADRILRDENLDDDARAALDEAVRLERAELFKRDSKDVEAAERLLVEHLRPNPREIKRFDNAFRLQLHVANSSPACGLDFGLDDLIALGKSIVLRLRWPRLGDAIDEDEGLLLRLEANSNSEPTPVKADQEIWRENEDIRRLLYDDGGPPARRPSRLKDHLYLRVS